MAAVQKSIGRNLYLFHDDGGRSKYLLITAHGIQVPGSFRVPSSTRLNFYAPSKQFLVMPQSQFELGTKVMEQLNSGSNCPNYILSKYQGSHGDIAETYDSLKGRIDLTSLRVNNFDTQINNVQNRRDLDHKAQETRRMEIADMNKNLFKLDFLTIRNRNKFNPVSFKKVLEDLDRNGYHYNHIFCSFCRGRIPFVDRTHTAQRY